MKTAMTALLVGLLALAGCAFNRKTDAFLQVQPGMDEAQVQSLLGQPIDRKFVADHDEWTYRQEMGRGIYKTKVIVFDNRKVVALADDAVAAEREYQLAKARATAGQNPAAPAPGQQPPAAVSGGPMVMPPAGQTPPPSSPVAQGSAAGPSTGTSSAAPAQPGQPAPAQPPSTQPAPPSAAQPAQPSSGVSQAPKSQPETTVETQSQKTVKKTKKHAKHHPITEPPSDREAR